MLRRFLLEAQPDDSGQGLYFQFAVQDGAVSCDVSLGSALRTDVP